MSYKELDFALGYFGVVPAGFKGTTEDTLFFTKDCPEDIKDRVLKLWPLLVAKEKEDKKMDYSVTFTEAYI